MVVIIRERTAADVAGLLDVADRVRSTYGYPVHLPEGDLSSFLTEPEPLAAWVAVVDGAIAGQVALSSETSPQVMELVASLKLDRPVRYIARLIADPDTGRRGVGRCLLRHAAATAEAEGCQAMLDVVPTPGASAAIAMYRSDGWQEVGRVDFTLGGLALEEIVFKAPEPLFYD